MALIPAVAQKLIEQKANDAKTDGNAEGNHRRDRFSAAQCRPCQGGGQHRRKPRQRGDEHPGTQREPGQTDHITENILGCAGQQKEQKSYQLDPFFILQKAQGLDFLPGKEHLSHLDTEAPHEAEHCHAADEHADQTQAGALDDAKSIAGADLQRLTGDDGYDDLQHDHTDKGQTAPDAVAVHPVAKTFGFLYKLNQRPADEPGSQGHEQNKNQNTGKGQCFAMPFCHVSHLLFDLIVAPFRRKRKVPIVNL